MFASHGAVIAAGVIFPPLAVGARCLHDIGKSGWWQLITLTVIGWLVLVYCWVQPAGDGGNK